MNFVASAAAQPDELRASLAINIATLLTIAGMSFTAFVTVLVILFITKEKKKEVANG